MAISKHISIDGLEDLKNTLENIAPRDARNLMRATVYGMAQQVAKQSAAGVPGNLATLRKAIRAKRGRAKSQDKPFADVNVEHGKQAKNDAFYWRFFEYGTKPSGNHPGLPESRFIGKAIAKLRSDIPSIMREQFAKKYAAMLKKQAKKAAKNGV